jgi:hypothetical protein
MGSVNKGKRMNVQAKKWRRASRTVIAGVAAVPGRL